MTVTTCRHCGETAPAGAILPGLCPVGRGGVHEAHDLFGPVPTPAPKKVTPEASEAGRNLRRAALAAGHKRAQQAGDAQEKESPGWFTAAIEHVVHFGRYHPEGFLLEDAAVFAYNNGLPQPREKRSWGAVPIKMKREEPGRKLAACGYATDNFGSPKTKWRIE